ncbi:hypothetical protein ACWEF6_01875 [Amycolatopsis sp. NPDC004772]
MAAQTHTEDPRTGCWEPAEGVTVEDVYELYKVELPHGSELVRICPTDGCVNPDHQRPTFFVSADEDPVTYSNPEPPEGERVEHETFTEVIPPAPAQPVKRGPGRPRKHPR